MSDMNAIVEAQMMQFVAYRKKVPIAIPLELVDRLLHGFSPRHEPRIVGRSRPCAAWPEGIIDDSARAICSCCQERTSYVIDLGGLPFCIRCCERSVDEVRKP